MAAALSNTGRSTPGRALGGQAAGVINAEGDMKIHVINVSSDRLELDGAFKLDFAHDVPTGPVRPHGVVLLSAPDTRGPVGTGGAGGRLP